jgi:O-antigen ligase
MTATTMSVTGARTAPSLQQVSLWLLLAFVGSLQISIAAANVLLAAVLVCWVALLVREGVRPAAPRFFVPLAAYAAVTLIVSAFSLEPATSLVDSKQLLLFLVVPAVFQIVRSRSAAGLVIDVIVSVGAASAAFGIVQYGILQYDSLQMRPDGALSHYMTYSGTLMLVMCAAVARILFGSRDRIWPALVMPALIVALAVSLGRNAWIGACLGIGLLLMLKDLRLTALLPIAVALILALAPASVTDRVMTMFDANNPTNQDRFAMIEIGARIVADHPLTGVGPNMVPRVYERYRPDYAVEPINPHLHNVPVQIAAERGLPALAIWIWFVAALAMSLVRLLRGNQEKMLAATAIAATAAMVTAGLAEYNFGDSEFLMLFLVLVTLPFAANKDAAATARS